MRDEPPKVTDAELAILEFLWDAKAATKREITEALYPPARASEVATVHKLLERLENKGYVTRDRRRAAHRYAPTLAKDTFVGRQLEAMAEKLAGGSLAPLVMHLVENKRLTKRELAKLRALLEEHK